MQVRADGGSQQSHHAECEVGVEAAFVELVEHDTRHVFQKWIVEQVAKQDAGGDGDAAGVSPGLLVEANVIAEAVAEAGAVLIGHPPRGGTGSYATRFEEEQLPGGQVWQDRGRYASGFARTGRCPQNDGGRLPQPREQLREGVVDGQSGEGHDSQK